MAIMWAFLGPVSTILVIGVIFIFRIRKRSILRRRLFEDDFPYLFKDRE